MFVLGWALAAAFFAPAATAAGCPNEAIRQEQTSPALPGGTTSLPGCMALEMVSPPKKFVQAAFLPAFSSDGQRIVFKSTAGLAGTPGLQSSVGDYYVASRAATGWATAPTSPAFEMRIVTGSNSGGPYAFTPDLGRWLLFGATQAQNQVGVARFFEAGLSTPIAPLSPLLEPIDDSGNPQIGTSIIEAQFTGSSTDLSTTLFRPRYLSTTYLPGDPTSTQPNQNEYLVSKLGGQSSIQLLARDRDGVVHGGTCGTTLGGGVGSARVSRGGLGQGAVSGDGSRIYFTTRPAQPSGAECSDTNPLRILERTETATGPEISELVPGGPAQGDDLYQGASVNGTKIYFTTTRQLVSGDQDAGPGCSSDGGQSGGCDLYLYDSALPEGERLIQVSAGGEGDPTPGAGADVLSSITAISGDGSRAYFVAEGVLTTNPNPEGAVATAGKPNLYLHLRDAANPGGRTSFVGTLSEDDREELWGVESSFAGGAYAVPLLGTAAQGSGIGGDGHLLLFASAATLTAEDTDSGYRDAYRYDSQAGVLICVSCAGDQAFDVSVNPNEGKVRSANFTEPGRWVSEDGETVAFATAEPLSSGDGDGVSNPYLWKAGLLGRLPAEIKHPVERPTASAVGNEVAFVTDVPLLHQDGDTALDVYVARVDGGFPNPPAKAICSVGCQGPASPPPGEPAAASSTFSGRGNVKPRHHKKKTQQQKKQKKQQKKKQKKKGSHKAGGRR